MVSTPIYVISHRGEELDIDKYKIFANVDKCLDTLRDWLEEDDFLLNYSIAKHELVEDTQTYESTHEYDLDELIDVDDSDVSIIDSE